VAYVQSSGSVSVSPEDTILYMNVNVTFNIITAKNVEQGDRFTVAVKRLI
jgi:hypothetical protein